MLKQRLLGTILLLGIFQLSAQEIRTIDGIGNNLENPDWGAVNTSFLRVTDVGYADGISTIGGTDWPNPRDVSNLLFEQPGLVPDLHDLSDCIWVFGQFIDHDITLSPDNSDEPTMIPVPQGDPWFDPFNTGQMIIPMHRSDWVANTGTDTNNPRQHYNAITAFIDGSAVYGSEQERANWLRTFEDGKLKTSLGNLLPFNTIDGSPYSAIDPNAPEMADPVGISNKHFVAGDVRANENPLLSAFHILFVREHNRLCDELADTYPDLNDEELYQAARRIVGALIQAVTFEEWLPEMGIELPAYGGYIPEVNPGLSNMFAAAAYRLGHTLINSEIIRLDSEGNTIPQGNIGLKDAFFNPWVILNDGGVDPLFKGMASQVQQACDVQVIPDIRNFLFGPPGSGGLDLASINIHRGRERGLPDFNTLRESLGFLPYNDFSEMTSNTNFSDHLAQMYSSPSDFDPWVGLLTEDPMPDAMMGETLLEILEQQFAALRDGDRFYYENDTTFTEAQIMEIQNTRLSDIILRNTAITVLQNNVFVATPHDSICVGGDLAPIAGNLQTPVGQGISPVDMELIAHDGNLTTTSLVAIGNYGFPDQETCLDYEVSASKDHFPLNGVTTFDMVLIRKHILGVQLLDSPYKLLAADLNQSGTLTTFDLVEMLQLILQVIPEFSTTESWGFVPASLTFTDPTNPWLDPISNTIHINTLNGPTQMDFIGYKMGDVNYSALPDAIIEEDLDDRDNLEPLVFETENTILEKGEVLTLNFSAKEISNFEGFQFTFNYDQTALDFIGLSPNNSANLNANNFNAMEEVGAITTAWAGASVEDGKDLFSFTFLAKANGLNIKDLVSVNSRYTKAEAVHQNLETTDVALQFSNNPSISSNFELYQNRPNPFAQSTIIPFYLPQASAATLTVYDVLGRLVKTISGDFPKGNNEIELNIEALNGSGVFYYELESESGKAIKKMMVD